MISSNNNMCKIVYRCNNSISNLKSASNSPRVSLNSVPSLRSNKIDTPYPNR